MEHDLTEKVPHRVQTRFELAIRRMVDAWLDAGRMEVSAGDVKLAREFLEHSGCRVEEAAGGLRVFNREGHAQEMTHQEAVLAAFRRLAAARR